MDTVISYEEYKKKLKPIAENTERLPDFFYECINYFEKYEYMVKANQSDEELMWKAN